MTSPLGHSFGHYTLLEQLGEGGMAIVYDMQNFTRGLHALLEKPFSQTPSAPSRGAVSDLEDQENMDILEDSLLSKSAMTRPFCRRETTAKEWKCELWGNSLQTSALVMKRAPKNMLR